MATLRWGALGFSVEALEAPVARRIKHAVRVDPRLALLSALAHAFLPRLPSEALVISVCSASEFDAAALASVVVTESVLGLRLARRKTDGRPATWWHRRWCASSQISCPVHASGQRLASGARGRLLFSGTSSAAATEGLRDALSKAGVRGARARASRAMRRGHAWGLLVGDATIGEIKRAGGWKSSAFLRYLPADELECIAALEARGVLAPQFEGSADQRPPEPS